MVSKTFLAEMAEKSPFVLFQDRLYQITDQVCGEDLLSVGERQFGLVASSEFGELERLFRILNSREIYKLKRDFIQNSLNQEIKKSEDVQRYIGGNEILRFILYEVFPLFVDDEKEIEAAIKGGKSNREEPDKPDEKTEKTIIEKAIEEEVGTVEVSKADIESLKKELLEEQSSGVEVGKADEEKTKSRRDRKDIRIGDLVELVNTPSSYWITSDGSFGFVRDIRDATIEIEFRHLTGEYMGVKKFSSPPVYNVEKKYVRLKEEKDTDLGKKKPGKESKRVNDDAELEQMVKEIYRRKGKFAGGSGEGLTMLDLKVPKPTEKRGLMQILGNKPVLVLGGEGYVLMPKSQTEADDISISLNGRQYVAGDSGDRIGIQVLEETYRQYLSGVFKLEAVEEFEEQVKEIQKVRSRNKLLEGIRRKEKFEIGDVGFLRESGGGSYLVYLKVPKFAMKKPGEDVCYRFESCRVGIRVHYERRGIIIDSGVMVIEPYSHPFLSSTNQPFQYMCNSYYASYREMGKAQEIAKRLDDGRNVLMHGLTLASIRKHGGGQDYFGYALYARGVLADILRGRKMSVSDAKKQGYVITNVLWEKVDR